MSSLELSPANFRELARSTVELAAGYLETLDTRPIFPPTSGEETERLFRAPLPENGLGERAFDALGSLIDHSRAHNGRFFGYVHSPGEPVAALGDLVASILAQNITAWRSAPAPVTVERVVVQWLAEAIGCPEFSGSLTGGGSSANLMALAMAREAKIPANDDGLYSRTPVVVYASEQIHMSIPKALALLGLGRRQLRLLPIDSNFRMIPGELERSIQEDTDAGKIPIAVVASAGTVNTGAIDPLADIAAIARGHGLWLHVDGAYGALAALAEPSKFTGLNHADSLSLDPHKWLYQPLDCGCLLYRDAALARKTFAYTGDYARTFTEDPVEGFAFFEESIELSRRFRALKLWLSLRYHGLSAFRQAIQRDLDHAQRLADAVSNCPTLELAAPVELSAVCFRHLAATTASEEERNRFNRALLKRIQLRGRIYLSNAELHGHFCLRACMVNHRTADADIDSVVPEVLAAADECAGG
jgi:aromatic-L-amino-acid/L-tryptophan decarboxylase